MILKNCSKLKLLLSLLLFFTFGRKSVAQDWPVVMRITDSAEYVAMEPMVDSAISYLRNTLPQDDVIGRMKAVDFLDKWISGVPYIIINQLDYLLKHSEKNHELMTQHVAGKLAYLRAHPNTPPDSYASELNGLIWMIDLYELGSFPTMENMDELVEMRKNGEIETWLARKIPSDWEPRAEE
ncbi:MAG: hypothetical protein EP346_13040 [Bacteroidetes bacterium]|nr:MAG: hypothetical protein EP346_13040 [Bacteroidota bacterium]